MYTVTVSADFNAIHRVRFPDGTWEPLHGHDWQVRACFRRAVLDEHSMVVDFCAAGEVLESLVSRWRHGNLNEHPDFADLIPTAEIVCRVVFDGLRRHGMAGVYRVEVTEAPHCVASYEPAGGVASD